MEMGEFLNEAKAHGNADDSQQHQSPNNDDGLDRFLANIGHSLLCPICHEIFVKAVTLSCSHSYCEWCIGVWLKNKRLCPVCSMHVSSRANSIAINNCVEMITEHLSVEMKRQRADLVQKRIEDQKQFDAENPGQNPSRDVIALPESGHGPRAVAVAREMKHGELNVSVEWNDVSVYTMGAGQTLTRKQLLVRANKAKREARKLDLCLRDKARDAEKAERNASFFGSQKHIMFRDAALADLNVAIRNALNARDAAEAAVTMFRLIRDHVKEAARDARKAVKDELQDNINSTSGRSYAVIVLSDSEDLAADDNIDDMSNIESGTSEEEM